jgi:hypothetical protein
MAVKTLIENSIKICAASHVGCETDAEEESSAAA